jgi:hypothetical protein
MNSLIRNTWDGLVGTVVPLTIKGVKATIMERELEKITGTPASVMPAAYGVFADLVTYTLYGLGAIQLHQALSYTGIDAASQKVATEEFVGQVILGTAALIRAGAGAALGATYRDAVRGISEHKRKRIERGTLG